ncbi:MAG: heme exporter protein CcmD [Notoacmeibacter sp.]
MDQAFFVTASYAVSAIAILALTLWLFFAAKTARANVERLEKSK